MLTQSKGKIFLAEERGLTEVEWFRSYNTFNFGGYFNEHKVPFGSLYVLNEDTLSAGRTIAMQIEEGSAILLIPIAGTLSYKDSQGNSGVIEAGQVQWIQAPKGLTLELSNPSDTDMVKFLQIWYRDESSDMPVFQVNQLMGREEAVYPLTDTTKGIFAFVIEGVFEIQHRLLHPGDGLALWGLQQVEMEALSNDAIVLLVEIPMV